MKVVARINGEDQALVDKLKGKGLVAKLVKGAVVVELPKQKKERWDEEDVFEIPAEARAAKLFLDVSEHGGGATNTGSGTVVCGLSGKRLRPYYVPRGGHLAGGTHAYFSVPEAVITVTGYRRDENITICEHRIVTSGITAQIVTKELWSGEMEFLPGTFKRYQEAAEAAYRKGNCYHCRCVHFAEAR